MRPTGVTVLAILNFLGAASMVICGLLLMLGLGLAGMGAGSAGEKGGMALLLGLGAVAGVVFLVFAAVAIVVGIGLWRLRNWARILTIILAAISLLPLLPGLMGSMLTLEIFSLIFQLVFAAFYGWIIWYMLQPHVKRAFGAA
jgi:uncharacterized membrane protein (DUF2068 family)